MTLTDLYLFMVLLPNLHGFSTSPVIVLPVMLILGGLAGLFGGAVEDNEVVKRASAKATRWGGSLLALLCGLYVVSPSNTQVYSIAGRYVATNVKDIEKLPDNLVGAANAWLKKAAEVAVAAEPESKPKKKQ